MTMIDFIVTLFVHVDDALADQTKDPRSLLWPSEVVTLGILYTLKAKSQSAFDRWLRNNFTPLFTALPERTRLFKLLRKYQSLADRFLAPSTGVAFCDAFGIELIHPRRHGRSGRQIGKKGYSNHRWIAGVKFCPLVNGLGQIVDWDAEGANVYDATFQRMLQDHGREAGIFADSNFHWRVGDVANLVICRRGACNLRMLIETLFSQLSWLCDLKRFTERAWPSVEARLGYISAGYNLLHAWAFEVARRERRPCGIAEIVAL
jgi:hypothetical protein